MDTRLKGRMALVTGASRGIGRAIAEALGAEGCHLHLAARDEGLLQKTAERISRLNGVKVRIHPADLSRTDEVIALGKACSDVDILVNNAGDIPTGSLQQIDAATWRRSWDLKVFGYIDLTREILPSMYGRGSGVVVNVIGVAGAMPNPNYIAGCVGNCALNMFTRCLGGESIRHGVRVVAVNPGPTMSDRHLEHVKERALRQLGDENRWAELEAQYPAGRSATVEEVAHAVVFLVSDLGSHISGTELTVDGGLHSAARR